MYMCLQRRARLTTTDPLQCCRMHSYHRHSCSWGSLSDQVCPLSALTSMLSHEHLGSLATPREHGAMQCRSTWSVARVNDRACRQSWNYKIHPRTPCGYSPDDEFWCRSPPGLLLAGSKLDPGHLLAAFDSRCVGFGPRTPPSTCSAAGKRYLLSARMESMDPTHSALDSKRWRS